jgi:hypothetical protein
MPDDAWKLKVENLLGGIDAKLTRALEDTRDHEKRIEKVEGKVHYWSGASGVAGVVTAFVGQYFLKSHA